MKTLSNRQLFETQQKKLNKQDEQLEECIGYTKKGKELGKELKNDLEKQNRLLEEVDTDVKLILVNIDGKSSREYDKNQVEICCLH